MKTFFKQIHQHVQRTTWNWYVKASDRLREYRHAQRKSRGLVTQEVTLDIHSAKHDVAVKRGKYG